jgi:catalase
MTTSPQGVADGLGLDELPERSDAAREPVELDASPALSIVLNGVRSFGSRTVGALDSLRFK